MVKILPRIITSALLLSSKTISSASATVATSDADNDEFDISIAKKLAEETLLRFMGLEEEDSANNDDGNSEHTSATTETSEAAKSDTTTIPTTTDNEEEDENLSYDGSELIEWINSNGGHIHPNARIGLDPSGQYRGVFVKTVEEGGTSEGIANDDIIGRIPW